MKHRIMARTPLLASVQRTLGHAAHGHITRRAFLKSAGLLATSVGGLLLPQAALARQAAESQPRIAIVGAGLAGMSCAYTLLGAGYTPTVYEARDRVGGRTYTFTNVLGDGLVTEVGGEFINSDHQDMLALAAALGLELLDTVAPEETGLQLAAHFDGGSLSYKEMVDLFEPFAERIAQDAAVIDEDEDVFERYNRMNIADYLTSIGVAGVLYRLLDVAFTTENGLNIDQQSALNFLYLAPGITEEGTFEPVLASDERYKIRGGNQQIALRIADMLGERLYLSHALTRVAENDGVYTLSFSTASGPQQVTADYVVLAIPFSTLRRVTLEIFGLTDEQRQAIADWGYGTNGKLMVGMDAHPWRDEGYSGTAFTDQGFQSGWDSSVQQSARTYSYTFFNGGSEGVLFQRGDAEELAAQNYVPALDNVFAGALDAYNGRVERMVWAAEEYSAGSYSCPQPGQYDFYDLFGGPIGRLLLAGEHLSEEYFGYMNGAAQSGRLAAETLLEML
jgi:monoamine oxidase